MLDSTTVWKASGFHVQEYRVRIREYNLGVYWSILDLGLNRKGSAGLRVCIYIYIYIYTTYSQRERESVCVCRFVHMICGVAENWASCGQTQLQRTLRERTSAVDPWMLCSENRVDHRRHYFLGMDALFSEQSRPWRSLGCGHGCSLVKRTRPRMPLCFGHGCSVLRTE